MPLWIAGCWLSLALTACGPAAGPASSQAAQPSAPAASGAPRQHLEVAYVAPSETMAMPWIARESQIGSTSHTFLRVLLAREGIPLEEVQVLQAGGNPQAATAMLTGATDAATVSGVMVPAAERAGAVTLADGKALKILVPGA